MRVAIATSRPFHLVHLGRELAACGHDVTVFGYMPKAIIQRYSPGNVKYIPLFQKLFPHSALALQKRFPNLQAAATERLMLGVDRIVAEQLPKCDVFIGLSGVAVECFNVAKEKYGAITICDRGSSHVRTQQNILANQMLTRLTDQYVERELAGYSASDFVTVPSMYAEHSFLENGFDPRRLFVNNYGVDLARFRNNAPLKPETKHCRALFVGAWSYQKGADVISMALELDPTLFITHIGTRGDVDFPGTPQFKSLGPVSNSRLASYYSSHDVFILPSRQDGFGMVLLEAMACGTPIIASRNTGGPDIANVVSNRGGVTIMEVVTPEALVHAVQQLKMIGKHGLRPILDEKAKLHFTWAEYGRRYSDFLSEATSE